MAEQPIMRLGDREHGEQAAKHERADCRPAQHARRAHAPTQRSAHGRADARRKAKDGDGVAGVGEQSAPRQCARPRTPSREFEAAVARPSSYMTP